MKLYLDELMLWVLNTVILQWSADTMFWQLSIEHNIDVQYQVTHQKFV